MSRKSNGERKEKREEEGGMGGWEGRMKEGKMGVKQ